MLRVSAQTGQSAFDMYSCHTDPKKNCCMAARIKMKETFFDTPKLIMTENTPENVTQDDTAIETVDTSHGVIVGPSSKHREKCEVLLKECLNGSYAKMPEFATEAWHYLSEAVEPGVEPVQMVHNLGVRAAHLMKVCSDIEAEKTTASTPKSTSILET